MDIAAYANQQQRRADANAQSCSEFAKALRAIRDIAPAFSSIHRIADRALNMPWITEPEQPEARPAVITIKWEMVG